MSYRVRHRRTGQTYTASVERCGAGSDHWHVHLANGCAVMTPALFHNVYELIDRPAIDGQLSLGELAE